MRVNKIVDEIISANGNKFVLLPHIPLNLGRNGVFRRGLMSDRVIREVCDSEVVVIRARRCGSSAECAALRPAESQSDWTNLHTQANDNFP